MTRGLERSEGRAVPLVIGLVLAGCSVLGIEPPGTLAGDVYVGGDAATITVTTEQLESGSVYLEGSLRFARLDGPSSFDWAVNDGSGSRTATGDRHLIGVQTTSVEPGDYFLTAWEQVCDGNCDNLDQPQGHCTLEFTAMPGEVVEILVSYTVPQPCVAERLD
jgi:hypothetical protein